MTPMAVPHDPRRRAVSALLLAALLPATGRAGDDDGPRPLPDAIRKVLDQPLYRNAAWGLRVVDLTTGRVVHSLTRIAAS